MYRWLEASWGGTEKTRVYPELWNSDQRPDKLVSDNTDVNQKLKQENAQMGGKMQELVASHDQAVGKYHVREATD